MDIRNYGQFNVGEPHIAHIGNLTLSEADQIIRQRALEDQTIAEATAQVTGVRPFGDVEAQADA